MILHGAGVPALIPSPERYAVHNLIVKGGQWDCRKMPDGKTLKRKTLKRRTRPAPNKVVLGANVICANPFAAASEQATWSY